MKDLWNEKFKPMLLDEMPKPFNSKNYIFEVKYDGIRALIYVSKNEFKIISRNLIDITHLFPELKEIQKNINEKVIFDGEIICTKNGFPYFSNIQKRMHLKNKSKINEEKETNPAYFMCFDIIYKDKNLTNLSLLERKKILNIYKDTDHFIKTKYITNDGIELFKKIKKNKIEGIIAKLTTSKYDINTRTKEWIKIKNFISETFIIGAYSYKEESNVFSVVLGEYDHDKFNYVSKVFISKKNKLFNILMKEKNIKNYFDNFNEVNYFYVKPKYKIKVKYIERTESNHLRQPFYVKENNNE